MMDMVLQFDGGGLSQGGPGGFGAVLAWPEGVEIEHTCGYLPDATNNEAEYCGLIYGMVLALGYRPSKLHVLGDSQLVIRQNTPDLTRPVGFQYKTKPQNLRALQGLTQAIVRRLACPITWEWVPRLSNTRCDELATKARKEQSPEVFIPATIDGTGSLQPIK